MKVTMMMIHDEIPSRGECLHNLHFFHCRRKHKKCKPNSFDDIIMKADIVCSIYVKVSREYLSKWSTCLTFLWSKLLKAYLVNIALRFSLGFQFTENYFASVIREWKKIVSQGGIECMPHRLDDKETSVKDITQSPSSCFPPAG